MAAMVMDKLKFCNFKLDILLSVTQSINNNDSVSLLLKQYAGLLHNELNIPNVLLYSCEQSWQPLLASGIGETLFDKISVEQDLFLFKTISTTNYEKNAYLSQFDMIIPIFHKDNALAYLLIGDSAEHPGMSFSIKHLQFIQTVTNVILVAIENKRLAKEQSKQEAFMVDLHLAARMQKLMIPEKKNLPNTDKLQADGFYKPHLFVGGDFYDFIRLSEFEYGFAIADVTGKGVSAALLMSNLQANLRASFDTTISLVDLVKHLNQKVLDMAGGDRFITMFVARYNTQTRELSYINAGHIPPVFVADGGSLRYLRKGCVGLGMLDEIPAIAMGILDFEEKARLICFTDGLVEVKLGTEVVENYKNIELCAVLPTTLSEAIESLVAPLTNAIADAEFFDDISVLGIDFFA